MQSGYEDRIADLRAQVDRISSRQLLDQEQYEQKLDQIVRRQTTLRIARVRAQCAVRRDDDRLDPAQWPRRPNPCGPTPVQALPDQ